MTDEDNYNSTDDAWASWGVAISAMRKELLEERVTLESTGEKFPSPIEP